MAGGMEPGSGSLPVSVQTVLLYIDNASKDVRVSKKPPNFYPINSSSDLS
jgi:hypothetical protein